MVSICVPRGVRACGSSRRRASMISPKRVLEIRRVGIAGSAVSRIPSSTWTETGNGGPCCVGKQAPPASCWRPRLLCLRRRGLGSPRWTSWWTGLRPVFASEASGGSEFRQTRWTTLAAPGADRQPKGISIFTIEGIGGGNNFTQYMTLLDTDAEHVRFIEADTRIVGGKGVRLLVANELSIRDGLIVVPYAFLCRARCTVLPEQARRCKFRNSRRQAPRTL